MSLQGGVWGGMSSLLRSRQAWMGGATESPAAPAPHPGEVRAAVRFHPEGPECIMDPAPL